MAIHRFWRQAKAPRRRRGAALLAQKAALSETAALFETMGMSGTARRVNRVVAVSALFGAFGTVALAVALTPGAQTPASSAAVAQEDFKISRVDVPPEPASAPVEAPVATRVAAASPNVTVVAVQPPPEPAPKADRLYRAPRAPEDRNDPSASSPGMTEKGMTDKSITDKNLTGRGKAGERDVAMAETLEAAEPKAAREAAESAGRKLDEDDGRDLEFGLSEPPVPGESLDAAVDDSALEEIEDAIETAVDEAAEEIAEEVPDEVVEPAAPEPAAPKPAAPEMAATRTAPVTTDVNMRARPDNGAAVIKVVPGKSTVEVIGCDYWCEVVYEGKRGFIYKGFVRGS